MHLKKISRELPKTLLKKPSGHLGHEPPMTGDKWERRGNVHPLTLEYVVAFETFQANFDRAFFCDERLDGHDDLLKVDRVDDTFCP